MATIQFNLFSDKQDGGEEIAFLTEQLNDSFNWITLIIEDYRSVKMSRESIGPIQYTDEYWQSTIFYELWMEKE